MKITNQTKGKMEQVVADLTDDEELDKRGKADERAGKAKDLVDDLRDRLHGAIDKVKDKLTKK